MNEYVKRLACIFYLYTKYMHTYMSARYLNNRVGYRAGKFTITIKYVV